MIYFISITIIYTSITFFEFYRLLKHDYILNNLLKALNIFFKLVDSELKNNESTDSYNYENFRVRNSIYLEIFPIVPHIVEIFNYNFNIRAGLPTTELIENIYDARNELIDHYHSFQINKYKPLYPNVILSKIFYLPKNILNFMGIDFKLFNSRIFNIILWLIPIFISIYSKEARDFINSLPKFFK